MLGMTPNEWCHAYPCDSADSSAWIRLFKWSPTMVTAPRFAPSGTMEGHWSYDIGVDASLSAKARQLAALDVAFTQRTWRNMGRDLDAALAPFKTHQTITPWEKP
jgi:hypothetical protein